MNVNGEKCKNQTKGIVQNDLKLCELNILDCFISLCEKYNLRYFLVGGSCLGAVRHKGFIPWDDDIDVAMPRADYDKFIDIAQENLPENLFLQCSKTEPDYRLDFAKIRNTNTTFIESASKNLNINKGIYMDVFPIDGVPEKKRDKRLLNLHKFIAKNYLSKDYCRTNQSKAKWVIKKSTIWVFCILNGFQSPQKVLSKLEKHYRKYRYEDCGQVVCHGGVWKEREVHPRSQFGNGRKVIFDGRNVIVPENTEEYLKSQYGDWKMLPPEEKRVTHHFYDVIDTEKSFIDYMERS